ncbi:uncharacterized protein LOC142327393 isoform X2 [Lycorma delicatula]|uniref:uncharacterized protein LOC142327393 isoform X2 n=1 Tax=Lycorma delicatula TaxID=130591 RepID=UPI003F519665
MSSDYVTEIANLLDTFFKGNLYLKISLIKEGDNISTEIVINRIPTEFNEIISNQSKDLVIFCDPVMFNSLPDQDESATSTEIREQSPSNDILSHKTCDVYQNKNHSTRYKDRRKLFASKDGCKNNNDETDLDKNNELKNPLIIINKYNEESDSNNPTEINNLKYLFIPSSTEYKNYQQQDLLIRKDSESFDTVKSQVTKEIKEVDYSLVQTDTCKERNELLENNRVIPEKNNCDKRQEEYGINENVVHIVVEKTNNLENSVTQVEANQRTEDDKEKNNYICKECNKGSKNEKRLLQHEPICCICQQEFISFEELKEHCEISHNGSGYLTCSVCNKMIVTNESLQKHITEVHSSNQNQYRCTICNKSFVTKLNLTRHIDSHAGKKTASCNVCGKSFRRSDYLQTHYKIHLGERIYACKLCPKRFIVKYQLKTHEKIHTGVKDHVCNVCQKGFARSDKLKEHMLRHLNIKRFKCNVCGKYYAENRDLKAHLKLHIKTKSS